MKKLIVLFLVLLGWDVQLCNAYSNGTLWPGKSIRLEVDASMGYSNPRWSVTNPTVSLAGSGFYRNVTAEAYFGGSCTITCAYDYYVGASKHEGKVTWEYGCADNPFALSPTTMNMKVGEEKNLSWIFEWATYTAPLMQFSGYDTSVIAVSSDGAVTAKAEGSTIIYATSNLGSGMASCVVNVSNAYVSPVTVSIPSEVSLVKGETYQFLPTVTPADNNEPIEWITDNPEVASIGHDGKLTANAAGVATITARLDGGQAEDYCMVTVRNADFALKASLARA